MTRIRQVKAYAVHAYTASGMAFAFLAAIELMRAAPDPRLVLAWLAAAVVIDATDGVLARRWQVERWAPEINGRTIDDIVDYLTFTFLPLLLVWRMGWVPQGSGLVLVFAMMASLFGFAHTGAKYEDSGFFRGFPSYWNIYALYAGPLAIHLGAWPPLLLCLLLAVLTLAPVRFIYPNRVAPPWRLPVLLGAALWTVSLCAMWPWYPAAPPWLLWVSLIYPVFYIVLSLRLDLLDRRSGLTRSSAGDTKTTPS